MSIDDLDRLSLGQTDGPATSRGYNLKFCSHIPVPPLPAHLTDVISVVGQDARVKPHRSRRTGPNALRRPSEASLSLIHISEPTRRTPISYAVFCLKKKK